MNLLTLSVGLVSCFFGLFILFLRISGWKEKLGKLAPMQERFGEKAGSAIHLIAYVIAPVLFGMILIFVGIRGVGFRELL